MLGYLHPQLKNAPKKIKEQYRALYCGLCHALKRKYGYRGVACLNYEVTFLLLLVLSVNENQNEIFHGSCSLTPFVRVPFLDYLSVDVETAANISIIVASSEIKVNVNDNGTFVWKFFDRLLHNLNKKATEELSEYEQQIQSRLIAFYTLEKSDTCRLDQLLCACGDIIASLTFPFLASMDGPIAEIIARVANNLGQWIYLVDACDDLRKDIETHSYNPLRSNSNYPVIHDKLIGLQTSTCDLISTLPLNEYGELVLYFTNTCIPQRTSKILEKYKKEVTL